MVVTRTSLAPAAAVTVEEPDESEVVTVSPARLAPDLRSADDRDLPSRTDVIGAALSGVVGGPVGRHAMIGRAPFLTRSG